MSAIDRSEEQRRMMMAKVETPPQKKSNWHRFMRRFRRKPMAIKLGSKVRNNITGFVGTAIGRTEWIHGCARITIQPPVDKDGKHQDALTFDEQEVEVVEETPVKTSLQSSAKKGGPQKDPGQRKATSQRQTPARR